MMCKSPENERLSVRRSQLLGRGGRSGREHWKNEKSNGPGHGGEDKQQ